ncbi:hypothetical protein [Diaphorobacter caeni]|uniref:hypothetical protein n=1 Tax=Diaphorobacter caeni TaxID=2784387 RepID=UPI002B275715|nr:hypothetical protein [Diaphorobacter caeni]
MLKHSPTPEQLAGDDPAVLAAIARSRKLLKNRALIAAVAGAVPIPGLDWAAQAALLSRIIPKINAEFGLTPQQLDALSPEKRQSVQNAVAIVGSALIGKFVTREMRAAPRQTGRHAHDDGAGGQVRAAGRSGRFRGAQLRDPAAAW